MTDTVDALTVADVERQKLQRHFGRFDILFFLICTIVGVDTIATVAQGGGQAFTWMMIFALVFFVPQALLFAELGTAFPQEGGPYFWTRLAFGHLAGAVNNFLYWITNPVWIGGTLDDQLHRRDPGVLQRRQQPAHRGLLRRRAGLRVDLDRAPRSLSFSVGKWLPTAGAFARFLLLGLFTLSVIIYASKHGVHGLGASGYKPSTAGFVAAGRRAAVQLRRLRAAEQRGRGDDQPAEGRAVRDRPVHDRQRAAVRACRCSGILIVLPTTRRSPTSAASSTRSRQVFTVYGGSRRGQRHGDARPAPAWCSATRARSCSSSCLLTSGVTWIMGSDRALAVSCYDGAGAAVPRRDQRPVRHAGAGQRLQRHRGDGRGDPGPADHQRQRRQVLRRGARRDHLHHADQLPAASTRRCGSCAAATRTRRGRSGCRSTGR